MSRSTQEIKASILTKIEEDSTLSALNSTSQTAIYNLFAFVIAQNINFHEQLWDILKAELEEIALESVPGTGNWWKNQILSFQYGDVIQLIDYRPTYTDLDESKRIITRCAVSQESSRRVTLKVAKGSTIETLSALSETELSALKDYVDNIKFVGTVTDVISLNADRLKITANIYYSGQYVSTTVLTNVKDAIGNYLATIPFNGVVNKNKLIDAIQNVSGVNDVDISELKGRAEQDSISSTNASVFTLNYLTKAGYIITEDTNGHKLDTTLTMILS